MRIGNNVWIGADVIIVSGITIGDNAVIGAGIIMCNASNQDIDNLLEILDGFCNAGESRMKLNVSEEVASGDAKREYHHGRCDIGSPWAKGTAFDVLEDENEGGRL